MVGWLTALLFGLIAIATLSVREHATFEAPPPSGEGTKNSISPEYESFLEAYASSYFSYMRKQDAGSKAAMEEAKKQLNASLESMRKQINQNQEYIQTFLDDYQDTNPELNSLHLKAQKLEKEGPKIADELVVSQSETVVDYTGMITRLIVFIVIIGVALGVNSFA
jgi:hypothetical protein